MRGESKTARELLTKQEIFGRIDFERRKQDSARASDEARELLTKQERFGRRDSERREQDSATDSESKIARQILRAREQEIWRGQRERDGVGESKRGRARESDLISRLPR